MDLRELLRQYPFLRVLFFLIVGIFIAERFDVSNKLTLILLFLGVVLMLLFVMVPKLKKSYKIRPAFGLIVIILFTSLGVFRTQVVQESMFLSEVDSCEAYQLKLIENPVEKANTFSCVARITESVDKNRTTKETANIILYFKKDSLVNQLNIGDRLLINSNVERVKNAGNPNEFDYSGYLKTRHILYSSYVNSTNWLKLPIDHQMNIRVLAWKWRDQLLQIYRDNGITNESFDILAALTLGYKTSLDPEVRKAWADAGAMHVLAVSGLHVGIIYLVMSYLLSFLLKIKYGRWIRTVLLLIILWLYALITGLSPSVMRAACMFSFIVVGEAMKRKGGVFNSLAASAFFLLLYNPYLIFTVGFQFSYLAVAGIVFLQPQFDKLLFIRNPILNKLWQLTTVALAAQIATFPLTIYYFNQFPSYFLLSGYVVILMAGILIYLSALLLIFSQVEILSNILGWILQYLIKILNQIIVWIQELPGAVIHSLSFSSFQVVLLYALIISLIFIVILRRKMAVYGFMILLISFQIPELLKHFQPKKQELIVFNAGRNALIAFRSGNQVSYLCDRDMEISKQKFLANNYQVQNHLDKLKTDTIQDVDFREFAGSKLLILQKNNDFSLDLLTRLDPDIILIRKSGLKKTEFLTKNQINSAIVIDGSVYKNDLQRLHSANVDSMCNLFVIKERGAFVVDLSSD
ncbi:ComEC/Rec2 family competence protein [Marinifilum sp. D737]|uniref:ComEC/Rec2 family competence protein n=1 Tax=Marinifilum sp. D737 TaxID=2969628 RepID=UPI002272B24A|nr:ComEC/Rec2 family competence protein [Marinifilum sp. D737]MCY1636200.1 ComEC family competence protein [Marinifilum sp. D737]